MATRQAYLHFGLPAPSRALDPESLSLFEQGVQPDE
jgi:holliday junction DNA helicase RuvB